jgi:preprotein translocase subunit YajC
MNWIDSGVLAAAPAAPTGFALPEVLLLVGFVLIFYFLLWRPQSKRRKEHMALMSALTKGDEVVTVGGLVGHVTKVEEDFVKLQIANNLEVRVQKSAVGATLPKGTLKSLDGK